MVPSVVTGAVCGTSLAKQQRKACPSKRDAPPVRRLALLQHAPSAVDRMQACRTQSM